MRRSSCLLFALLVGCASPPPDATPAPAVDLPSGWTAGGGAPGADVLPEAWWREFGDAVLAGITEESLGRNPSLLEAEARLSAAHAVAEAAGAEQIPWLGAGVDAARERRFIGENPPLPETLRSNAFSAGIDLSWEIDLWGRVRAGQAAALADQQAQLALVHGARLSLAGRTVKAYLGAVESRLQLEVAQASLASASELADSVRERFERGLRRALDLKLSESEVASARSELDRRRRTLDASLRQLEILAGRYPSGSLAVAGELPALPPAVPAGLPADLLARRPDLVAAERAVAAAGERVNEAQAALLPRIALTGSSGLASADLEDLVEGDFGVWSLAAGLTAPIFQGGRLRAAARRSEARREEALAAFAGAALQAFGEVESALAAQGFIAARTDSLRELRDAALASLELSEERYLGGLVDILNVLEARDRYFAARSALLAARREQLATRVDLYLALGGGFDRERIDRREESPCTE